MTRAAGGGAAGRAAGGGAGGARGGAAEARGRAAEARGGAAEARGGAREARGGAAEGPAARPARLTGAQAHARYEALVARAMTAEDPVAALRAAAEDPALPPVLRRALLGADEDGVRMSALLVARLRFERLLRGSPEAEAWFDRDPAEFSAAFRRYHAEVPPTAFFPPGEARLFPPLDGGALRACARPTAPMTSGRQQRFASPLPGVSSASGLVGDGGEVDPVDADGVSRLVGAARPRAPRCAAPPSRGRPRSASARRRSRLLRGRDELRPVGRAGETKRRRLACGRGDDPVQIEHGARAAFPFDDALDQIVVDAIPDPQPLS